MENNRKNENINLYLKFAMTIVAVGLLCILLLSIMCATEINLKIIENISKCEGLIVLLSILFFTLFFFVTRHMEKVNEKFPEKKEVKPDQIVGSVIIVLVLTSFCTEIGKILASSAVNQCSNIFHVFRMEEEEFNKILLSQNDMIIALMLLLPLIVPITFIYVKACPVLLKQIELYVKLRNNAK